MASNTETVEIIIEGTDNSVEAFTSAQENLQNISESAKSVGGSLNKLSQLAGVGEFGGFVGQIKNAGEALKGVVGGLNRGVTSAAALKAGLAALAGVVAFKISESIARWAMDIDGVVAKSQAAQAALMAGGEKYRTALEGELDAQREIAELTGTTADAYEDIRKASTATRLEVEQHKKAIEELSVPSTQEMLPGIGGMLAEERRNHLENEKALLQNAQATLAVYDKQLAALGEMTPIQQRLASLKKDAEDQKERQQNEADYWKLVSEQQEAQEARSKRLVDIFKQVAEEADAVFQAQEDRDWDYIDNLKLALEELRNGKEAADAMAAGMKGISEEAIAAGQEIQKQIDIERERKELEKETANIAKTILEKQSEATPELKAVESRFLTRGSAGGDPAKDTAKNTKDIAEAVKRAEKMAKEQRDFLKSIDNATKLQFAEVG